MKPSAHTLPNSNAQRLRGHCCPAPNGSTELCHSCQHSCERSGHDVRRKVMPDSLICSTKGISKGITAAKKRIKELHHRVTPFLGQQRLGKNGRYWTRTSDLHDVKVSHSVLKKSVFSERNAILPPHGVIASHCILIHSLSKNSGILVGQRCAKR